MTVIVSSTAFRMDTSCSLLKNVSSALKMEAEVSSRIFVQAVCCLAAQGCTWARPQEVQRRGSGWLQSNSVARSALLPTNRTKIPKILFFIERLQYTMCCLPAGNLGGTLSYGRETTGNMNLDDWLIVHYSITLVNFQLDAQNSYLFICNTFIKILYMFQALPCSSSGGLRHNCIYAAPGIITLCR